MTSPESAYNDARLVSNFDKQQLTEQWATRNLKMYIVIKEWLPTGHALNTAAHAGLIGWLEFGGLDDTQKWLDDSFKKVTCMVSDEEFAELKKVEHSKVITEGRLDNDEVAIVFAPRNDWPPIMKTLRLWK